MRKVVNFILRYYNSLLLILVSLWLGALLISVDHSFLGGLFIFLSLLKLIGTILDNVKMRIIGLVCLNAMWAVNTVIFLTGQHPKGLSYQFPLFVLLLGLGVGIRGDLMSEVAITAIITGVLTYLATQVEARYRFKEKGVESGAKTEGIYVENMTTILAEYKEQVSSFRDEVQMLREENQDIKRQLNDLQKERKEIIDKFNEERTYYERELELKDELIEVLQVENEDLKQEIIILKEDK